MEAKEITNCITFVSPEGMSAARLNWILNEVKGSFSAQLNLSTMLKKFEESGSY